MGLRIGNSYDYRNDKKTTGTHTASNTTKPVIHLAANDNPNPSSHKKKYVLKDWKDIKKTQANINALPSDEDKVIEYHKQNAEVDDREYVIVKKGEKRLEVHSADGTVVESFEIGIGKQKGDDFAKADRPMTSAGIYTVLTRGTGKDDYAKDYGSNIFIMETERGSTGVSIHQIPNGHPEMYRRMNNGNLDDNRYSGGGIDLTESGFTKLAQHIKRGSEVYVLPENSNNKIVAKDGQLNLVQEKFTGQVLTSLKPTRSNPILIDFKSEEHKTDEMKEFAGTLESQKEDLMKNLDIDNDTYNDIASMTLGIVGQETKFGTSKRYRIKNFPLGKRWVGRIGKWLINDDSIDSKGLTQTKIEAYTSPEVKKLFAKYGINKNSVTKPKESATATMIGLTDMYKNELPSIEKEMKELGVSKEEALLYLYQGKKYLIKKPEHETQKPPHKKGLFEGLIRWALKRPIKPKTEGKAEPQKNSYIRNVKRYLDQNFSLQEAVLAH